MKTVVYKITRSDNEIYIGITKDPKVRFRRHELSERFAIGIKRIEILEEHDNRKDAEEAERKYIEYYDSFYNGLNDTIDGSGNHLSPNFTTLGKKLSEETRKNISKNHAAYKDGYVPSMLGKTHSKESKKRMSKNRKGKIFGPCKLIDYADTIRNEFLTGVEFPIEFITLCVKNDDKALVGKTDIENLTMKSGHKLTYTSLFIKYYSEKYNCSKTAIRHLISGKTFNGTSKV